MWLKGEDEKEPLDVIKAQSNYDVKYIFLTTTTTTRKKTKPYHPIIARNEDFQF